MEGLLYTGPTPSSFLYGCDKLFVGTDHRPLLAFFRKDDPKPLDHIWNKRLRKYVAEIGELRFSMFHIKGLKNFWRTEVVDSLQEMLVMTKEMVVLMT